MDGDKRSKVIQMLAEVKGTEVQKSKTKGARAESTVSPMDAQQKDAQRKGGGVELIYLRLGSEAGLADALKAIANRRDD